MQRNVLKATVPDRRVWLPTPAYGIAVVRLGKALEDAHSKGSSNLHVRAARFENSCESKKSIILTPCTSTSANEQRVTEFLYQAVELSTSDCSIFTEN